MAPGVFKLPRAPGAGEAASKDGLSKAQAGDHVLGGAVRREPRSYLRPLP